MSISSCTTSRPGPSSLVVTCALACVFLLGSCGGKTIVESRECTLTVLVSPTTVSLQVGETSVLGASVSTDGDCPAANVSWTSSQVAVATVSGQGMVTAVGEGAAVITATATARAAAGGVTTATAQSEVSVEPACEIDVDVAPGTATVEVGLRISLSADVSANSACSGLATEWSSSDGGVATVESDGKVTAVAPGTATISAHTTGATGGSSSATASVTVTAPSAEMLLTYVDFLDDDDVVHSRDWVAGESGSVSASPLSLCAEEGGVCDFAGERAVFFGAGDGFARRFGEGPVDCSIGTFGDPAPGAAKRCYVYLEDAPVTFNVPEGGVIGDFQYYSNRIRGRWSLGFRALRTGTVHGTASGGGASADLDVTVVLPFLINRWSFNEIGGSGTVLEDAVGDNDARIVEVGPIDATVGGGQVTIAGGARDASDYVSFDHRVLPNYEDLTLELWATPHAIRLWSRIFDFGKDGDEFFMMSWTRGMEQSQDRIDWGGFAHADDTMAPYELDREYQIVVTMDADLYDNSSTVTWYRDGEMRGTFTVEGARLWGVTDFANNFLGRSNTDADETGSASYDEVRVWQGALTPENVAASFRAGPGDDHPLDTAKGGGR